MGCGWEMEMAAMAAMRVSAREMLRCSWPAHIRGKEETRIGAKGEEPTEERRRPLETAAGTSSTNTFGGGWSPGAIRKRPQGCSFTWAGKWEFFRLCQ